MNTCRDSESGVDVNVTSPCSNASWCEVIGHRDQARLRVDGLDVWMGDVVKLSIRICLFKVNERYL